MEDNTVGSFPGFDWQFVGYTPLPHDWLDDLCLGVRSISEMKVILYIMRHTCGFTGEHDTYKHLTIDDFVNGRTLSDGTRMDRGTGLSEMSVRNGLRDAEKHGFILCKTNRRDLGRIKKYYKLNLRNLE